MINEWWIASKPGDMRKTPWLHPAVVAYMDMLIEPDFKILEHGAGGSTVWFAERCAHVDTAEHDMTWAMAVQDATPDNVEVHYGGKPGDFGKGKYDLLFIDGARDERIDWIRRAHDLVKDNGIIVVDNSNRPEYANELVGLKALCAHSIHFDTNPPNHKHAVTTMFRKTGNGVVWL